MKVKRALADIRDLRDVAVLAVTLVLTALSGWAAFKLYALAKSGFNFTSDVGKTASKVVDIVNPFTTDAEVTAAVASLLGNNAVPTEYKN